MPPSAAVAAYNAAAQRFLPPIRNTSTAIATMVRSCVSTLLDDFVDGYSDMFKNSTPQGGVDSKPTATGKRDVHNDDADVDVDVVGCDDSVDDDVDANPCSTAVPLSAAPFSPTRKSPLSHSLKRGVDALYPSSDDSEQPSTTLCRMREGLAVLLSPARLPRMPNVAAALPRMPTVAMPSLDDIQGSVKRTFTKVSERGQHYVAECVKGVEAFAATFDSTTGGGGVVEEQESPRSAGLQAPLVGCS